MVQALRFRAVVSGRTLSSADLDVFEGKRVEVIVVEDPDRLPQNDSPTEERAWQPPLGLYKGQASISDDFDAPLPPDVQRAFEGDGPT